MVWTDPDPIDYPYYGVSSCCGATAEWKIDGKFWKMTIINSIKEYFGKNKIDSKFTVPPRKEEKPTFYK